MKNYESLTDALVDLKERGYTSNFEAQSFCLYCGDLDIRLNPEEFHVDEVHRLQGEDSSPDDTSIVFAITSSTGVKGTLVDNSELEQYKARLIEAKTLELKSSHVPMVSMPRKVAAFIIEAASTL
jgi:hypothetical protein